jgi:hypothetical protein
MGYRYDMLMTIGIKKMAKINFLSFILTLNVNILKNDKIYIYIFILKMYYKQYKIINEPTFINLKILRFIYNNDINNDANLKLLNDLKELAKRDEIYYNGIDPWNDIEMEYKNREVIIIYNTTTNNIQGWCNIEYSTFSTDNEPSNLYNLKIDKIVSREESKIKYIGLLLLEFIRDECINKPILYYHNNPCNIEKFKSYEEINISIMYLYSLTTTINYYKKTFLTQLYLEDGNEHVFIYINPKYIETITKRIKTYINQLNTLHLFECNSVLSPYSIKKYNEYKVIGVCNKNPKLIIDINDIEIDYIIKDRVYGPRMRDNININNKKLKK